MHMLIIGGGLVGSYLAGLLQSDGHSVTVIEAREAAKDLVQRTAPGTGFILGNGTDPFVLESAGVRTADVVAAVTGADETNLVITSLARFAFNVPRTVARVNNPHHTWMFTPVMGVDVALNQADAMAHMIAQVVERQS
ncbi:MAG: TrkA family potassium uptake protein [Chloroflexales bacterium]